MGPQYWVTVARMSVGERSSASSGADRVPGVDLRLDLRSGRVRSGVMEAFREAVRSGRLAPGTPLPSARAGRGHRVARNTVVRAYAELVVEGWLIARPGSGTEVSPRAAELVAPGSGGAGGLLLDRRRMISVRGIPICPRSRGRTGSGR